MGFLKDDHRRLVTLRMSLAIAASVAYGPNINLN